MSFFENRFKNHAVHAAINKCIEALESYELQGLTEEHIIAINRFGQVVKFAKAMINQCDPNLVSQGSLDQLNNAITQVFNHWNQFIQNRNWNILTAPCDTLLSHIAQLTSKQRPIPKSYADLLGSLRDNTAKMLRQIREAKQQQDDEIEEFEGQLQELAMKLQSHESQIEAQKTRMDSLLTQQQETFSKAQESRTEKFSSFIADKNSEFEDAQAEQTGKFEALQQQHTQASQKQIDSLESHCSRAKEIVGIIGNIGVTGNYQKIANQEKKAADIFRWIAVGCFGAMLIAVIVVLYGSFKKEQCDWSMALFRVLTAAIFAAPGIYCAMESSKHRRKEQENRKLELELASISPFLEKLNDKNKASMILEKLAPEYFGNHAVNENGMPLVHIDPKSVEATIKPILEFAKLFK